MSKIISKSVEIGGRTLTLETGRFASRANASVLARYGDTAVLVAVVSGAAKEDQGFLPLSVEYIERLYAGGRIKGSRWVKREGRPSDEAILVGRIVDRSLRPLFPKNYLNELQITITVLSVDLENDPDILSVIAASAALAISDIPWNGPIGTVRIGLREGSYFVNPTNGEQEFSELDLVISASRERVVMIEAGAEEVSEESFLKAIKFAQNEVTKIISVIELLVKEAGVRKVVKEGGVKKEVSGEIVKRVRSLVQRNIETLLAQENAEVKEAILEEFPEEEKRPAGRVLDEVFKKMVRERILQGLRPDARAADQIRPIEIEVGVLPRTHGSAIFSRGQTQVLSVATLGAPSLEQLIESPEGEETKRYIHHYSMPPYSLGEVGRMLGPSRREIGHGALAERALEPVIPPADKFPYTTRVVSEVLSSNGSTSMAAVCGSTLSLMDAGVPIKTQVAGISVGLVTSEDEKKWIILSDISGIEDFYGDMDFKVAGTEKGISAVQLDVKISGLTEEMISQALARAREGRIFILEKMRAVIPQPRAKLSQYAPRVKVLHVDSEKIGEVIGPGGKIIRKIIAETGAMIDVEDDGTVNISGVDDTSVDKAVAWISGLTREVKIGEEYLGEVKRIQPFGAFVEISPGKEGLVHVSQMAPGFVANPAEVVSLGQKVKVRVAEIDEQGRVNLSMLFGSEAQKILPKRPSRPAYRPDFPPSRGRFPDRFRRPRPGFKRSSF